VDTSFKEMVTCWAERSRFARWPVHGLPPVLRRCVRVARRPAGDRFGPGTNSYFQWPQHCRRGAIDTSRAAGELSSGSMLNS